MRNTERPEGCVLPGFLISSRPERGVPKGRALLRVLVTGGLALAVLMPALAGASTLARRATRTRTGEPVVFSTLPSGARLFDGQSLVSPNGRFSLDMQADGNLVLYGAGLVLWDSGTVDDAPDYAILQGDGNLVIYQGQRPMWSSGTDQATRGVFTLTVQDDGNVVLYSPAGKALWNTYAQAGEGLQYGDSGPAVRELQAHLNILGYWLGTPNGYFGDSTQQAVWALQKAADLPRSGYITGATAVAIANGVVPKPRPASGNLVEVNLQNDLVMIIQNGKLAWTLNTSTGGGYTYTDKTGTSVAITPTGVYHIFSTIDGLDVDSLGALWRPRFFTEGGIAIHGDSFVPPYPVSHGCVRVSDEAINWIWANNIMPIGEEVWVF
ncbi:MAG: L,D-transpeptidase family protein [Acidimicrobiales bacterium]